MRTLEDVAISVARVEERIYQISTKQKSIESQISSIEANVQDISNKANNRFSERIFWIIVAVLAATIFSEF